MMQCMFCGNWPEGCNCGRGSIPEKFTERAAEADQTVQNVTVNIYHQERRSSPEEMARVIQDTLKGVYQHTRYSYGGRPPKESNDQKKD